MTIAFLIVCFLATHRGARLVTTDELFLFSKPREWVNEKWPTSQFTYLVNCPWCSSWWIGMVVVWTGCLWQDHLWWKVPTIALAASTVTGYLMRLEPD